MPYMRLFKYIILAVTAVSAFSCTPDLEMDRSRIWGDPSKGSYSSVGNSQDKTLFGFCLKNYDLDRDGTLSAKELSAVTVIDCSGQGLYDMTGLGNFSNLDTLRCSHNNIRELDLSQCKSLRFLDCSYNFLEKLDVSTTSISTLYCYPMTDAAGNNLLKYLFVSRDQTINGVTNGRDASKGGKRIPDETTIISVPTSKDGDTDTQKTVQTP